ncbi:MAG: copper-binding protein [Candidatus Rokubacteria bacterium]|nr:copper-binding protein [Candidatus Rokubacteria bacterium]
MVLLAAFAAGLWGTIVRPPAYEVKGEVVARPSGGLLLVRHEEVRGLGMRAMEMMAVTADPALLDGAGITPGDRVRLAVRPRGDEIVLLRIEKAGTPASRGGS